MCFLRRFFGFLAVSSLMLGCAAKSEPGTATSRDGSDASVHEDPRPPEPSELPGSPSADAGRPGAPPEAGAPDAATPPDPGSPPTATVTPSVPVMPEPVPTTPEPVPSEPAPQPAVPADGPPEGWRCTFNSYADGATCHCGCGVRDPDCQNESVDVCDVCLTGGSCSGGDCPGSIAADDNAVCDIPEEWTCSDLQYGDGMCHCGCGTLDVDCQSAARTACDMCHTGCSDEACPGTIDSEDNTLCTGVPATWVCDERSYGDGSSCDCGCGLLDPDCTSEEVSACDNCELEGSCSPLECPGIISATDISKCTRPEPPEGWTCGERQYVDGTCDCGCGAPDRDCDDARLESCGRCDPCGGNCMTRVDSSDTTECIAVPPEWRCEQLLYSDGESCNCGCAVVDPDCPSADATHCELCGYYIYGCSVEADCSDIVQDDNAHCLTDAPSDWTCDPTYYDDGACDCGCGVRDLDCATSLEAACDFCNNEGSCSAAVCPGTVDPMDNAVCTQ